MADMRRYAKPTTPQPQREEVKWDDDPIVDQLKKINFNTFKIKKMLEEKFGGSSGGVNDSFLEEETR